MKRFLIVAAALALMAGLAGGLTAYTSAAGTGGQATALGVGDTYEVVLDSNPSTGYQWLVDFDAGYLELVNRHFEVDSNLNPPAPGTGGKETFVFRAVAKGSTQVELTYKRPWENDSLRTQVLTFEID